MDSSYNLVVWPYLALFLDVPDVFPGHQITPAMGAAKGTVTGLGRRLRSNTCTNITKDARGA